MIFFHIIFDALLRKCYIAILILRRIILFSKNHQINLFQVVNQLYYVCVSSLAIVLITASFISMIFTFQVGKELISLSSTSILGTILTLAFIRELCPVLTAVIVTAKIGSSFAAEIASMQITEQISILLILKIDPINYLIIPRIYACIFILPILNIFSIVTSIFTSIFISSMLFKISPFVFIYSLYNSISYIDLFYSSSKALFFGFLIGFISCSYGLSTKGGTKNVGITTTSSIVLILLLIFLVDFLLSYIMFYRSDGIIQI